MFLWQLLKTQPMSATSLILSMATLFWCLRLLRWQHTKKERYLMGVVGLFATYQGLHVLQNTGFWPDPVRMQGINSLADFSIAALCFIATLLIQVASADRHNNRIHLRMVEAHHASPRLSAPLTLPRERSALAVLGVNASGEINLWHTSSEDFFGWKKEEVLGTRLPFKEHAAVTAQSMQCESGLPNMLVLRTKHDEDLETLAWFIPVPGETGSLVLVLDYRKSRRPEQAHSVASPAELSQEWSLG